MAARGGDEFRVADFVHGLDRVDMRQQLRPMFLEILEQLALGAGWPGDQHFFCRSQRLGDFAVIGVLAAKMCAGRAADVGMEMSRLMRRMNSPLFGLFRIKVENPRLM